MRIRWLAPTLVAAVLAAAYVVVAPPSVDLAAHLFRARLFGQEGFALWNNLWYSGHYTLSYSVLFPAVSWLVTPQLAAAVAVVGTTALFSLLAYRHCGDRGLAGAVVFGAAIASDLYTGRLAFDFGALPAMAAITLLDYEQPAPAAAFAVVSALCSPVAALFAALIAAGYGLGDIWRTRRPAAGLPALAVIAGALIPVLVVNWLFPAGGAEPFAFSTMVPLVVLSVSALVLLPRDAYRLRAGVALYLVAIVTLYLVPTSIGSNIARLGTIAALPLVTLLWWGRRPVALAVVALGLLYMGWSPPVRDAVGGIHDTTASTAFYRPLVRFLQQRARPPASPFRVEIPFTQFHWEAYEIATRFSIARGWERQLDIKDNSVFYDGQLNAVTYRRWLHANAVRYVALARAPLDYSATAEARLIKRGLPYLHLVMHDRDWRVYSVARATPIVQGPATLRRLTADSLSIDVHRPGTLKLHVRYTPYWTLAKGAGCVAPDGSWTKVIARHAGRLRLTTAFAVGRIGASSPRCTR